MFISGVPSISYAVPAEVAVLAVPVRSPVISPTNPCDAVTIPVANI